MTDLLIGFLFGLSTSLIALNSLLKRYLENRGHFRTMIGRIYHKDQIPTAARIVGLSNLILMGMMRLLNLLELLSRPHHQGYGKLGTQEAEELVSTTSLLKKEAEHLHKKIVDAVKLYEHLQ